MTEDEFIMRVAEMIPDLTGFIMDKARLIAKSGAVDLAEHCNNYRLPKIFLSAVGMEIADRYLVSDKDKPVRNNFRFYM